MQRALSTYLCQEGRTGRKEERQERRGRKKKEGKEVASEKQVERFFTTIPSSNDRVACNL